MTLVQQYTTCALCTCKMMSCICDSMATLSSLLINVYGFTFALNCTRQINKNTKKILKFLVDEMGFSEDVKT